MPDETTPPAAIVGGVDTHKDLHTAAVVTMAGVVLGTEAFSTTRAGYRAMLRWFREHGELLRVGVEQTGSYGAGLTRHLALARRAGARGHRPRAQPAPIAGQGRPARRHRRRSCRPRGPPRPGGQGPLRRRRGPARPAHHARHGCEGKACSASTAAQHRHRRARRGARAPAPSDPHAADPHLRGLTPRRRGLARPGRGHPHRPEGPGTPHPRSRRRGRGASTP